MFKIIIIRDGGQTFFYWKTHLTELAFVLVLIAAVSHAALFVFYFAAKGDQIG